MSAASLKRSKLSVEETQVSNRLASSTGSNSRSTRNSRIKALETDSDNGEEEPQSAPIARENVPVRTTGATHTTLVTNYNCSNGSTQFINAPGTTNAAAGESASTTTTTTTTAPAHEMVAHAAMPQTSDTESGAQTTSASTSTMATSVQRRVCMNEAFHSRMTRGKVKELLVSRKFPPSA